VSARPAAEPARAPVVGRRRPPRRLSGAIRDRPEDPPRARYVTLAALHQALAAAIAGLLEAAIAARVLR
jgi:hypothetical protein